MSNFFNLSLTKKIDPKNLKIHLIMCSIWVAFFLLFILRLDVFLIDKCGPDFYWMRIVIPAVYFYATFRLMKKFKWYYYFVLMLYPLLQVFWFLPKIILLKGKIYLFSTYVRVIYTLIKGYRKTLIFGGLLFLSVILLSLTSSQLVSTGALILYSFAYAKIVLLFFKESINPPTLFSDKKSEEALNKYLVDDLGSSPVIGWIEKYKTDETLSEEDNKLKRLIYIARLKYILDYLKTNLDGYKGKRAFFIASAFKLVFFFSLSFIFFTVANYLIFKIDPTNFITLGVPSKFEFLYYVAKTMVNSSIDAIRPNSILSKALEVGSYYIWGVFCLIAIPSFVFQLRREKIKEKIDLSLKACEIQSQLITIYLKEKYNTNPDKLYMETEGVANTINITRDIISSIL